MIPHESRFKHLGIAGDAVGSNSLLWARSRPVDHAGDPRETEEAEADTNK